MNYLHLKPALHRNQPIIKVDFDFDKDLIALVKVQKGIRWSQTLRSWYFPKKEFRLNTFYHALKGSVFIDYSSLKTYDTPQYKKKSAKKTTHGLQVPKLYKEQLVLKRYSQNTVKTYCSCFLKFKRYFKGKDIDSLSKEEIKSFLLHLIQEKKVSPSTQNQYINAIKFYYEKVLKQPRMRRIK